MDKARAEKIRALRGVLGGVVNRVNDREMDQDQRVVLEMACMFVGRLVPDEAFLAAMGAPGDWGYGTPIGDALRAALGC